MIELRCFISCSSSRYDICCQAPFCSLHFFEDYSLSRNECFGFLNRYSGEMDENVFTPVIWGYESKAFGIVERFHRAELWSPQTGDIPLLAPNALRSR